MKSCTMCDEATSECVIMTCSLKSDLLTQLFMELYDSDESTFISTSVPPENVLATLLGGKVGVFVLTICYLSGVQQQTRYTACMLILRTVDPA